MKKLTFFIISLLVAISSFSNENDNDQKGYTINFENIQLKELLQFVSKIGNFNLIYNDSEIEFTVSFCIR